MQINDRDEGFKKDDWQYETRELILIMQAPLRADRWWKDLGVKCDHPSQGLCLSISCNIWACAQHIRVTHCLAVESQHLLRRIEVAGNGCYYTLLHIISCYYIDHYYIIITSLSHHYYIYCYIIITKLSHIITFSIIAYYYKFIITSPLHHRYIIIPSLLQTGNHVILISLFRVMQEKPTGKACIRVAGMQRSGFSSHS